jgi:hypothetical protein
MPSTRAARTTRSNDPLSGHGTPGALRVSVGVSSGRRVTVCSVTFPASAASLGCAGLDFFPRSQEGDPLFCVERGSSFVEGVIASRRHDRRGTGRARGRTYGPRIPGSALIESQTRPNDAASRRKSARSARRDRKNRCPSRRRARSKRRSRRGDQARRQTELESSSVSARAPSGPIRRMGRCAVRACKRRSRAACRPSTRPKTSGTCNPRDP